MRVAYLDLGFSKEDYSLNPTKYGGGAVVGRYMKEDPDVQFEVFAPQEAFANVGSTERADRCHGLDEATCQAFRYGAALDGTFWNQFDLVLHGHTCFALSRGTYKGPMVHWSGFDGSAGNPGNDYVLLYNDTFRAQFGERAKYVRIGKPVPAEYSGFEGREQMVVQVSRHDDHMGSVELAQQCLAEGFKGVFAGPIHPGCKLLDYIDNKTTFYLGEISETDKLALYRRAMLCGFLFNWDPPFNQTIIEAQGQGCPIYVNDRGPFLKTYLRHGANGFDAGKESLDSACDLIDESNSRAAWAAAREYDTSVMVASFKRAFNEIVAEWRAEHP